MPVHTSQQRHHTIPHIFLVSRAGSLRLLRMVKDLAAKLVDQRLSCSANLAQASLQLLEASNISPCIGRLRRHPTPANVSKKADTIARQWHAAASETLSHAKQFLAS